MIASGVLWFFCLRIARDYLNLIWFLTCGSQRVSPPAATPHLSCQSIHIDIEATSKPSITTPQSFPVGFSKNGDGQSRAKGISAHMSSSTDKSEQSLRQNGGILLYCVLNSDNCSIKSAIVTIFSISVLKKAMEDLSRGSGPSKKEESRRPRCFEKSLPHLHARDYRSCGMHKFPRA